jgi:indole-3-glycerol phosphate synthase
MLLSSSITTTVPPDPVVVTGNSLPPRPGWSGSRKARHYDRAAMASYLSDIVEAHRAMAAADRRSLTELVGSAMTGPPPRGFMRALEHRAESGLGLIAEIKRRSPSKGALDDQLDPAVLAGAYAAGGATCVSVLTDRAYFGGSPEDLRVTRAASGLPVLRKDFTVSLADVCDARLMGADAVLLIAAALTDRELAACAELASTLLLDALVEVHDLEELERALGVGAPMVGVNQRDLETFAVDHERALALAAHIPDDVLAVAESGIGGPADAERLAAAGYTAVLVGETLVRAPDPAAMAGALVGHPIGPRGAMARRP